MLGSYSTVQHRPQAQRRGALWMREPRKWGEHTLRGTLAVSPRVFYELVCAPRRRSGIGGWITTCDTGDDTCEEGCAVSPQPRRQRRRDAFQMRFRRENEQCGETRAPRGIR